MYRFFCPSHNITAEKIVVSDREQIHHIKDVLRFKINDEVAVFDDKGRQYLSTIEIISVKNITLKVKREIKNSSSFRPSITVACAIPKKSKMDDIVDKLTQLGVDRIVPIVTKRVIVRLDAGKKDLRKMRWQKIALNSAKQSQRNTLAIIEPVRDMGEALQNAQDFDLKLIGALTGEKKTLRQALDKLRPKNIIIFIGPEGDFTPAELSLAKNAGCIPVSLGDYVLRVETAAVCAAGFIRLYEDY